jgi:hypothetical protein
LVRWSKTEIVRQALRLGVPIERTWSCYSGGTSPCGVCDSCRIRDDALLEAGRSDLSSAGLAGMGAAPGPAPVAASGDAPPMAAAAGDDPAASGDQPPPPGPGALPGGRPRQP